VERRPGWILPAPGKVLVNVVSTDEYDVWRSQVEGSDESGTFIRAFLYPDLQNALMVID
jgi:hypothetical protein